jgi:serine/threonine protein kinase
MKNSNKKSKNIEIDDYFLNNYTEAKNYIWECLNTNKQKKSNDKDKIEGLVFYGEKNGKIYFHVKQIKFPFNKKNVILILKEIYFLIFLKRYENFVKLDDILLKDISNMDKCVFLVFKNNQKDSSNLNFLFKSSQTDNKTESSQTDNKTESSQTDNKTNPNYLEDKDLIKWIIYQITFGLYTLHNNNIIHNDIKPSNILINNEGGINICDFGSMCYKGEKSSSFTRHYAPPEFLLDKNIIRDEKSDMWSLGVIILELLCKKPNYFKIDDVQKSEKMEYNHKEENNKQLKYLISNFGIKENISNEELNKIINDNNSKEKYIILLNKDEIDTINDKDALDLISNLLVLNKNKRYSAEQVIKSDYLKAHLECFTELDLPNFKNIKNILDYNNNYKKYFYESIIDEEIFIKIYKDLYSKLNII